MSVARAAGVILEIETLVLAVMSTTVRESIVETLVVAVVVTLMVGATTEITVCC